MATRRRLGGRVLTKKLLEFEGIPELVRRANALMAKTGYGNRPVAQRLKQGMMKGALIIRDEARDIVPVVTGTLRDSIFAAYGDPKKADVIVGVNTRMAVDQDSEDKRTYAGIVEYGDDTRAPHPYMRPAINAARPLVARIVAEETLKAIQDLTKELG